MNISENDINEIAKNFIGMDVDHEQVHAMIEDRLADKFPGLGGELLERAKMSVIVTVCLNGLAEQGLVEQVGDGYKLA